MRWFAFKFTKIKTKNKSEKTKAKYRDLSTTAAKAPPSVEMTFVSVVDLGAEVV
jgi:hypothetical protein